MASRAFGRTGQCLVHFGRNFSSTAKDPKHYRMVVIGGGTGGCAVAARACRKLGAGNVAIVEPAKYHYYQAMWTLVGGGIKPVEHSTKLMEDVLPKKCHHHKAGVTGFDPDRNTVTLSNREKLSYDYLVISLGIQLNYNEVEGLMKALKEDPMVCSNYTRGNVVKTWPAIQKFKGGNAIFTFPNTPVKCAGAAQKVMYLADDYWRKSGVRDKANIMFNMSLGVLFSSKKYADKLLDVIQQKNITINWKHSISSIDHKKKTATFDLLETGEKRTFHYDFIHVTPPQSAPDVMKNSTSPIVDASGFLDVNKETMQHTKFPNIFGLGDCTNVPTSKTAAAIAAQNKVLMGNVMAVMAGKTPTGKYNGYTSCPLITGYEKCILAEFGFDTKPMETFPFDQGKQRWTMFHLKKDIMPHIYWRMLLKGYWSGPKVFRKIFHPFS